MKRFAAILLLSIFLFNITGFKLLVGYAEKKSDFALETRLDNGQYAEEDLVTVKVPIQMPYQTSWTDFERADGEIEFNGEKYKYVKRKVSNDTLILLCIRHSEKMDIHTKATEYFGQVNGLPLESNHQDKTEIYKLLMFDYDQPVIENLKDLPPQKNEFNLYKQNSLQLIYNPLAGEPPEC